MNILELNSPGYQKSFFEGFVTPLLPSAQVGQGNRARQAPCPPSALRRCLVFPGPKMPPLHGSKYHQHQAGCSTTGKKGFNPQVTAMASVQDGISNPIPISNKPGRRPAVLRAGTLDAGCSHHADLSPALVPSPELQEKSPCPDPSTTIAVKSWSSLLCRWEC